MILVIRPGSLDGVSVRRGDTGGGGEGRYGGVARDRLDAPGRDDIAVS